MTDDVAARPREADAVPACPYCNCDHFCRQAIAERDAQIAVMVERGQSVLDCLYAAQAEGFQDALLNTCDDRLKDLIERRLIYHHADFQTVISNLPASATALLKELADLRERNEWRPIESAPRDGTEFLLLRLPRRPWTNVEVAFRHENNKGWFIIDTDADEWRADHSGEDEGDLPCCGVAPDDLNDTSQWLWKPMPDWQSIADRRTPPTTGSAEHG